MVGLQRNRLLEACIFISNLQRKAAGFYVHKRVVLLECLFVGGGAEDPVMPEPNIILLIRTPIRTPSTGEAVLCKELYARSVICALTSAMLSNTNNRIWHPNAGGL
jgi:hypothetical protein